MNIMGIDPGFSGAISIINNTGVVELYRKMPIRKYTEGGIEKKRVDIVNISAFIAKFEPTYVFIERAQAMPKNGAVGMFNYGANYGMILGLCLSLEQVLETVTVPPRTWQKFMYAELEGVDELEPKARALARFGEIWPHLVEQNVTHDGIIDSLLIAEFGRRTLGMN